MEKYLSNKLVELPPVEFKRLIKTGYHSLETEKELGEHVRHILQLFDSTCTKLNEKCTLRIIFETELESQDYYSFEARILRRGPSDYYVILNVKQNVKCNECNLNAWAVYYEMFLVSDDMVEVEIANAKSLGVKVSHKDNLHDIIHCLLLIFDYSYTTSQSEADTEMGKPEDDVLEKCFNYVKNHEPVKDQIDLILHAIVDGISYSQPRDKMVYCLVDSRVLGEEDMKSGCKYIFLVVDAGEILVYRCFHSSSEFLSTNIALQG